MSFKKPLPVSHQDDCNGTSKQSKKSNRCRICGDKAYTVNYGTLSCHSCKTFFRRNGFNPKNVRPCLYNSPCEIDIGSRRCCAACRLAKCLSMGMRSNRIRKEVQLKDKNLPIKTSNNKNLAYVSQLPTLNLLNNDQSSLNNAEWTLLSNVIHAHDTFSDGIAQIRQTIEHLSTSSSLNMSYNVSNVYETITFMFTSMQSFIESSPDFRILTVKEQYSLFERNLHGVMALHSALCFRTTGIINNSKCLETFAIVYGLRMASQAKRLDKKLDIDLTMIKLMLLILAFSSNCFITYSKEKMHKDGLLNGTFRLFGSQNVYVELLWKYMIYRYGFHDSVLRFFRLIEIFLDLIKYSGLIYTYNEPHRLLVEEVIEQTEQLLIVNQNEQKLLWGKK